jgi:hypothetical protein
MKGKNEKIVSAARRNSSVAAAGQARRDSLKHFSAKWPPRTAPIAQPHGAQHREGGQVESVLGADQGQFEHGPCEIKTITSLSGTITMDSCKPLFKES